MKEAEGNITEAATVLQELQVETYGSMEKNEKVDFILEQMRLCLAKDDFIRAQIISKKISTRYFEEEGTEDYKLRFYKLMIQVDLHEGSYLAVCKHFKAIYETKTLGQGSPSDPVTAVFPTNEEGNKRWTDLKNRI